VDGKSGALPWGGHFSGGPGAKKKTKKKKQMECGGEERKVSFQQSVSGSQQGGLGCDPFLTGGRWKGEGNLQKRGEAVNQLFIETGLRWKITSTLPGENEKLKEDGGAPMVRRA